MKKNIINLNENSIEADTINLYKVVIKTMKEGLSFDQHIERLREIKTKTDDNELIEKIDSLISSLGSREDSHRQIGKFTQFRIKKDANKSAEELIEYCERCQRDKLEV